MPPQDAILVLEAALGSALYGQALALREAVLRQPLGLTLSEEELEDDKLRTHFCAVKDGAVLGCVSLKPLEGRSLQLKQMAVEVDRRLAGARSCREVSAPRTILARRSSADSVRSYFFRNASKEQSSST